MAGCFSCLSSWIQGSSAYGRRDKTGRRAVTTMPPPPLPELVDDLLRELFLRLPPDDPACLIRAALACKRWRRIIADPAFRRRHRELHRTPSLVGFLHFEAGYFPYVSCFVSNNPASGCPAAGDLPGRFVLDSRHGRVLFFAPSPSLGTQLNYDLVVWDPLTNDQRCLPRLSPSPTVEYGIYFNAAVLCSAPAEGCDHTKCHGGPFRVAFVWSGVLDRLSNVTSARVYCSKTGNWSDPISVQHLNLFVVDSMPCPSTLVGDTLYFRFGFYNALEYKLGEQRLSVIIGPPKHVSQSSSKVSIVSMEDGTLGCMEMEEDESSLRLRLLSWDAASSWNEDAGWTRGRAIDLLRLLPDGALPSPRWPAGRHFRSPSIQLLGFVEGTDVIFVATMDHITKPVHDYLAVYMVQYNSGRARKVFDLHTAVDGYTSFCIPVIDFSCTTEGPGDDVSRA